MTLQNRVDPWGRLHAVEARGTLMGNRGRLHDEHRRIVRRFEAKRWIVCLLEFKDRRRTVMSPHTYTELFFLDEATGLAAGHRPCFECQRKRYREFMAAWTRANPEITMSAAPTADKVDAVLHRERIDEHREKRLHEADAGDLPAGSMVLDGDDQPLLVHGDVWYPWSFAGYGSPRPKPSRGAVRLLTPPSIVNALRAGYVADVHPSAG